MSNKPKLLLFTDWYFPGFKAGGPIRSLTNFADRFRNEFEIYIFTSDRDLKDDQPYENVELNKWLLSDNGYYIFYASPGLQNIKFIRKVIREIKPVAIYLNSMYSFKFTLLPLIANSNFVKRVVLAPRGMLKPSAVRMKFFKKIIFLKSSRLLNLFKSVVFHATDTSEKDEILKYFPKNAGVFVIPNLSAEMEPEIFPTKKNPGELRILSVGRVHPIKNVDLIVDFVEALRGTVYLTIIGDFEDREYTENLLNRVKGNDKIQFLGPIPHEDIKQFIVETHLFLSPTRGENFGHAIFESLIHCKPIIISDQTPWKLLGNSKVGFDIPLNKPELFVQRLQEFVDMEQATYSAYNQSVYQYIYAFLKANDSKERYIQMFTGNA